jgi:hypothetical protein
MDQHTGQPADEAIFAANGPSRRRLLRALGVAFVALLAAWLIALTLGVWGGFDSLPGLPGSHSTPPTEASSRTHQPPAPAPAESHQSAPAVRIASPSPADSGSGNGSGNDTTHSQGSNPNATAPKPVQSPSTSSAPPSTSHGTTTTTGVAPDSPGNLPDGSEVPGQLP